MKCHSFRWGVFAMLVWALWAGVLQAQENRCMQTEQTEWMKLLADSFPVCKLSVPGTHDSGALHGGLALQTQVTDIPAQLRQGIRAFDIRLREKDGQLGVFHSEAFQQIYWERDVFPAFLDFLRAHPSETLIVSLKREGGSEEAFAALLSASLEGNCRTDFVETFRPDLSLGDCRGKILFLHRDKSMECYPGAACVGWADNATCDLVLRSKDGTEGIARLQDEYQYVSGEEANKKIDACIRHFARMAAEQKDSNRWGISFASATGLPSGTPRVFADQVNTALTQYLARHGGARLGIVFIDFVGLEEGEKLVSLLIDGNCK